MRLIRFLSRDELERVKKNGVEFASSVATGKSTIGNEEKIIFFFDLDAADDYVEPCGVNVLGKIDDIQRIEFYNILTTGITNNDYVIEINSNKGIIGTGIYAHPGWVYGLDGINIDDQIEIKEVGLKYYTNLSIVNIYKNRDGEFVLI